MLTYLDTNIVIYLVESKGDLAVRAEAKVAELKARGARFVVSDLVRMEARVRPLRDQDDDSLADLDRFFDAAEFIWALFTHPVFERAAQIRARWRFRPEDSLHLAAALEARCEVFLTNDARLSGFEGLKVEVLSPEPA